MHPIILTQFFMSKIQFMKCIFDIHIPDMCFVAHIIRVYAARAADTSMVAKRKKKIYDHSETHSRSP